MSCPLCNDEPTRREGIACWHCGEPSEMSAGEALECQGHDSNAEPDYWRYPYPQTVYCDGSCRKAR